MDTEAAIESQIRPQLVAGFGRQTANALLTQATLSYVSTDGSEMERFEAFLHTISSDGRVVGVWGKRAAAERAGEWRALAESLFDE